MSLRVLIFLLMILSIIPATVQGENQLAISASVVSLLRVDVVIGTLNWALDADRSPYTQMENVGVKVHANKAGWTLYVKSEVTNLTDWDGSAYGSKALQSPLTLESYPEDNAIGKRIIVTTRNQVLVTDGGKKGGVKKVGLGFTQPVSYEDESLPPGHTYHTVLVFTAAAA
jgi:hypothetical protein